MIGDFKNRPGLNLDPDVGPGTQIIDRSSGFRRYGIDAADYARGMERVNAYQRALTMADWTLFAPLDFRRWTGRTTHFRDAERSEAVTGDGDPLGLVDPLVGEPLVQPVSAERPVWAGTYTHFLAGTFMEVQTGLPSATRWTLIVVVRQDGSVTSTARTLDGSWGRLRNLRDFRLITTEGIVDTPLTDVRDGWLPGDVYYVAASANLEQGTLDIHTPYGSLTTEAHGAVDFSSIILNATPSGGVSEERDFFSLLLIPDNLNSDEIAQISDLLL